MAVVVTVVGLPSVPLLPSAPRGRSEGASAFASATLLLVLAPLAPPEGVRGGGGEEGKGEGEGGFAPHWMVATAGSDTLSRLAMAKGKRHAHSAAMRCGRGAKASANASASALGELPQPDADAIAAPHTMNTIEAAVAQSTSLALCPMPRKGRRTATATAYSVDAAPSARGIAAHPAEGTSIESGSDGAAAAPASPPTKRSAASSDEVTAGPHMALVDTSPTMGPSATASGRGRTIAHSSWRGWPTPPI